MFDSFAWAVGLLEGEGYFGYTERHGAHISCASTDEDVVRRLAEVLGFGRVYGPYVKPQGRKLVWEWHVYKPIDATILLQQLLPHMCNRRQEQIRKTLNFPRKGMVG